MLGNKKKHFIVIILVIFIVYIGRLAMIQQSIITDGDVRAGYVRIEDKEYEYTYFYGTERKKLLR